MVAQTKTLTYYLDWHDKAPQAESFIVSIGKRGINSVYWIVAVHRVEHRQPQAEQCYKLEVVGMQHLKPLTVHLSLIHI